MEKSKRREQTPKTRGKKQDNPTKTEGKTRTERREAEQR